MQARGVLEVRMDGPDGAPVIPPVDVFTMQLHLPGGRFPPSYGARDMFGCVKVFRSKLSGAEFSGGEQLLSHCRSLGHWRRLGKYFINGQLRETFNPGAEVGGAQQEGAWPAWELPAVSHPVQERQCGRQGDTSDPRYVIAVMRCPDLLQQQQQDKPPSLLDLNVDEPPAPGPAQPFKPPEANNSGSGSFGGMYSEGTGFKAGWEDPYSSAEQFGPRMGWDQGPRGGGGPHYGFGRGGFGGPHMGGGYGPGPGMGWGGGGYGPGPMGGGGFGGGHRMRGNNYNNYNNHQGFGGRGGGGGPRMRPPIPGNVPGPSNPEAAGMKKKITAEKKLEKYSGGEIVMPEGEEGDSNAAYTGKIGKTGFNSKKETAKYAALPPPGHSQWNNISGNENFKIDNSMANLRPVGANFKANKAGVRVCIPWKRGMCKLGDRCNYTHGDPQQSKLQALVDAQVSPLEKDLSGYRIAADAAKTAGMSQPPAPTPASSAPAPASSQTQTPDKRQKGNLPRIKPLKPKAK